MRRVEAGESFVITRNGRPVADLVPHARPDVSQPRTMAEIETVFGALPPIDRDRWRRERDEADRLFGDDAADA